MNGDKEREDLGRTHLQIKHARVLCLLEGRVLRALLEEAVELFPAGLLVSGLCLSLKGWVRVALT